MMIGKNFPPHRGTNNITEPLKQSSSVDTPAISRHVGTSPRPGDQSRRKQSDAVNTASPRPGISRQGNVRVVAGLLTAINNLVLPASPRKPGLSDRPKTSPPAQLSNTAAAVTVENGYLQVQSLGDRLRTLHQMYGDTPAFLAGARALLQENGLLHPLDDLPEPAVQAAPSAAAREVAGNVHSRHARAVAEQPAKSATGLAELHDLAASPADALARNEHLYFTAWRASLPPGEALAWLRNAPEDRQRAYKKLLDDDATSEAALLSAYQTALAEQPGAVQLSRQLRRQRLPGRPEEIRLTATLSERAGSLSAPATISLTLAEAWQTGKLETLLASDQLSVDIRSQRRLLTADALAKFKTGLHGIAAPPDVAMLNQHGRVRRAFRHLTEARFALSTLQADLKGELRSNDDIRGLNIVNRFRDGAADVQAGHLTFSAQTASGRPFSTPLSGWLVLRDDDANYVLYDADSSQHSHSFSSGQAMAQFVSKTALRQTVSSGRLETAAMAEGAGDARYLSEFFHDLEQEASIWSSRNATLSFMADPDATFDASMSAFSDRLRARNIAALEYSAATRDAAARVVSLAGNWERARSQHGMPTLLEHTRTWMQARDEYGKYLQQKKVIASAEDFDPDAFVIRSSSGKNNGTLTEFAAYLRRRESSSADFAANMEILPAAVTDDAYVSALSRKAKASFADTLSRAVNAPSGAKPTRADERYIATLTQDRQRALHTAMQMYLKLNQPQIKEGIDSALKNGYPGSDFQQELRGKIDFTKPPSRALRQAWNMLEVAKMQLALVVAQQNSTQETGDGLPAGDAKRIKRLLEGFPASARAGHDFMAPLTVGNGRVPGMVMFSLRDGQTLANGDRVRPRQYVYSPEPVHGNHVFTASDFSALLKNSQAARDVVTARVALADTGGLQNTFDDIKRNGSSVGVPVGYAVVDSYDPYSEMIEGRIADADEQTVSRWEVIRDATMTGVGAMALPACLAAGPVAAGGCAALTVTSLVDDGYEAARLWSRNERGMSLITGLLGALDVTDISKGAKAVGRAVGLRRGLSFMGKQTKAALQGVAGGMQGMLDRLGRKAFGSMADAADAAGSAADAERHSRAFEMGWLKRDWAVNIDLGTAQRTTPPGAPAGDFHELNGRTYIRERGYAGEAPMVYEVKVEKGGSVRVVNPDHPEVPADNVRWNGNKWVKDSPGLAGGGRYSDQELQKKLQGMKAEIEKAADAELACDTKTQRVLKVLQKDAELWSAIEDKVEVRVIKLEDDAQDSTLVLHPVDEDEARWSGHYHVYITVNLNGKRMIVDPYVGGPDSCATVSEQDFISHHWRGKQGKDYEIRNLAPYTETFKGGDPADDNDLVTYSVDDFMNNRDIYDPDYYPSHQFYYRG